MPKLTLASKRSTAAALLAITVLILCAVFALRLLADLAQVQPSTLLVKQMHQGCLLAWTPAAALLQVQSQICPSVWRAISSVPPFNSRLGFPGPGMPPAAMMHPQPMPQHRILSGPASPGTIGDGRFVNDFNQYQSGFGLRRSTEY